MEEKSGKWKAWWSAWWNAFGRGYDKVVARVDDTIGKIPACAYLILAHITLFALLVVIALLLFGNFSVNKYFTALNVIFLGFVLLFGLAGMSTQVKARVWSAFGLVVGLVMWLLSICYT